MRERPILFSAPMVRAILAGEKSQTRRIVKAPAAPQAGLEWAECLCLEIDPSDQPCMRCSAIANGTSPYGAPGDRLWVKESIRRDDEPFGPERWCSSSYIADGEPTLADSWPWKNKALPSIHCPRGLSRITLEVTAVRVERLQDIGPREILAEGAVARAHHDDVLGKCPVSAFDAKLYPDLRSLWAAGWDAINGERSPWSTNPWVWVVSFKRAALASRVVGGSRE